MDETEVVRMWPLVPVLEGVPVTEQGIVPFHANPANSVSSSATLHPGPASVSSTENTGGGCKRSREAHGDSDSVTEEEEIDSGVQPVSVHGGHRWTRR
jgi:hypothetical protein